MAIKMKLTFYISMILLFLMPSFSHSEVLWEDDFEGFTSWGPKTTAGTRMFPWTIDENYDPTDGSDTANGGGYGGITEYEPSTYTVGNRTNLNSWNGYTVSAGGHAIEIAATYGRDNSKGLRFTQPKWTGLSGETGIHKWLGNTNYQELYIRYYFKFPDTYQWNGTITSGDPDGNIIWKLGRVWTGLNPIDYDKTGGQSQPVEDTTFSNESNWRTGIWISRFMWPDWSDPYTPYFDTANFYAPVSCTPPTPTCDSQSPSRGTGSTDNIMDWAYDTEGQLKTWLNSGVNVGTDGTMADTQGWHCLEYYFKNNSSPGATDGDQRIWFDGTELINASVEAPIQASMSADSDDYGMNFVRFGDNWNNLTTNIDASPGYQYYYIDDIVISTSYIGPDYAIGGNASQVNTGGNSILNVGGNSSLNFD